MLACTENSTNITNELLRLSAAYSACGCDVDPCVGPSVTDYDQTLHVGGVFIILAASAIGTLLPLLSKHVQALRIPAFAMILGKCAAAGALMGVSLVHMVFPASASLTSPCVPDAFKEDYPAYAFLFALIGALLMHMMDFIMTQFFESRQKSMPVPTTSGLFNSLSLEGSSHDLHQLGTLKLEEKSLRSLAEAYMIEFAITIHSIFIGLAVGVADRASLVALLIALSFHQFFEGIALGSRVSEANISHLGEFLFGAIFSLSAPIGIAIGIGIYSSFNATDETFLLVQGILDGICGGILLYTGFAMLLVDFPRDAARYCNGKYKRVMQMGMFACVWIAAGAMAFIGRYL